MKGREIAMDAIVKGNTLGLRRDKSLKRGP